MKLHKWKKYIVWCLLFAVVALCSLDSMSAKAASLKELKRIEAYYMGGAVEVGKPIDPEKLYITAYYEVFNGYSTTTKIERITSGYTLTPDVVSTKGDNTMAVIFEGKVAQFSVLGKTVLRISAEYTGGEVTVGNSILKDEVKVTAYYSDGTSGEVDGFEMYTTTVMVEGLNTFPVVYAGQTGFVYVVGKEPLAVTELIADYNGEPLIVGSYISKSDIEAWALYNNGDFIELEKFNVSPATITKAGWNEVQISFGGKSTTIEIWGLKKEIVSIEAKYTGPGVIVGTTLQPEDVQVLATYNDGTVGETGAFTMTGVLIEDIGENIVVIFCDEFVEYIIVNGVEGFAPNYDNNITTVVFSRDYRTYSKVTLGLAAGVGPDKFQIKPMEDFIARRVVQRVVPTEEYIPLLITYDDDEMVTKFPMAMKVTLPQGYSADRFGVYYTPNQKTIMAKLDGEFLDAKKTEYQFIVYEPGAYILVHEVANLLVEEIIVEEELELKTNRNYSLKPVVLPKAAENKEVEYRSTDESVATVSETGKIRTYEEGTCEIWVEATDGSGVCAIVTIEVVDPKKKK